MYVCTEPPLHSVVGFYGFYYFVILFYDIGVVLLLFVIPGFSTSAVCHVGVPTYKYLKGCGFMCVMLEANKAWSIPRDIVSRMRN